MKRSFILSLLLLCLALFTLGTDASYANGIDIAYVGPTQLYAACQKAGGDFSTAPGTYGCSKNNCDGKGGTCSVACGTADHKCVGSTPGRLVADVTLLEFLTAARIAPLLPESPGTGGTAHAGDSPASAGKPVHPGEPLGSNLGGGFGGGIQ